MTRLQAYSILLLSLLLAGCSSKVIQPPAPVKTAATCTAERIGSLEAQPTNYEIALVVSSENQAEDTSAAWLGYLMARDQWICNNLTVAENSDFYSYQPQYGEELAGRQTLAQLWRTFRDQGAAAPDPYLDSLVVIEEAGYMEPYVWEYHYQDAWGPKPGDLPWVRYEQWMNQRLPDFQTETHGSIKLLSPGSTAQVMKQASLDNIQASN